MHWKALDLDPEQATARDVKRTYARLLKQCRPDQNPEGFRELHEAYQNALVELEWRARSGEFSALTLSSSLQDSVQTEPSSDDFPELSATVSHTEISPEAASIMQTLDELEIALKNNLPDVAKRVRASEVALFRNPEEAPYWGDTLHRLIEIYADHPDLRLKPEVMLFELEHDSVAATLGVIDRLDRKENALGINNIARLLLNHKDRIRTPSGGIAASRLACAAAFLAKTHVAPLSDFSYETLARGERDFHMQLIDRHVAISSLLEHVPVSLRNFWRQRLINNLGSEAWSDEASAVALRWLRSPTGRRSNAYEVLNGLVPEEMAESLKSQKLLYPKASDLDTESETQGSGKGDTFTWETESPMGQPQHRGRRTHQETLPRTSRYAPSWLLIFPFLFLLRFCATYESRTTEASISPPRLIRLEDLGNKETIKINNPALENYLEALKNQNNLDPALESYLETLKNRKEDEFSTPGSTKETDPITDPYLKLIEEGASRNKE